MRVAVPFGKKNIHTALVYNVHQTPPLVYQAKPIFQIIDKTPLILPTQLKHWQWIAQYYLCTLGEVMRAALPSALLLESETQITKNLNISVENTPLKDDEYLILEALKQQSTLTIEEVMNILDKKRVLPLINNMVQQGLLTLKETLIEKYQPKMLRYVKLHDNYNSSKALQGLLEQLSRAKKQHQAILSYFKLKASQPKKAIKFSELKAVSKVSSSIIKALIDKNILEDYYQKTDRLQYNGETPKPSKTLSTAQQNALDNIYIQFKTKDVLLLHGVTASGKTELYVKLIEQEFKASKQVLFLVPEIALTAQLVQRLQIYFGDKLAVFHSRYSLQERVEVWHKLLSKTSNIQLIVGARSALLLPFQNLGLIIVDEEHEQSYKQFDPAPRYNARDAAIVLAKQYQAKTLLGSATPSLESYYNAKQNKYGLVELQQRYNNVLMPHIELIDLKDKYKRKRMRGHFSDQLINEITTTLAQGFQIILFQNRRGFSPIVECTTCGHSPQCPNCDISLTYHQYRNQLRCHYCGYNTPMQQQCQACGSNTLDTKGFGTEQIEEEVKVLFPQAQVARMDLDTTRGKNSFEKLIHKFETKAIQILVGTQMLSKGLDFRNVKLVGVLNADNLLNFPDFRAHERSYQLLAQVAGRAGRTDTTGKVLIQTYNPHHEILQQVANNHYIAMYKAQVNERHTYKYPPLYRIIKLTFKHKDFNKVNQASDWFATALKQVFATNVLGPEAPAISRIRNMYIKHILIKIPQQQSLTKTKATILKIQTSFSAIKTFAAVRLSINVDNY